MSLEERLREGVALLDAQQDVLAGRVARPEPPLWCESRGWTDYLLALSDEALVEAELVGLAGVADSDAAAPASLRALSASILRSIELVAQAPGEGARVLRKASPRKREQVAALLRAVQRLRPPTRVIDVGAGQGHLTRELARELGVPAVGIERDPGNVAEAQRLTEGEGAGFVAQETDLAGLSFEPGDLAVGLHACGALGDALARAAARDGVDLLLVNCCLQKVPGDARLPVSALGQELGLVVPRDLLGLANLLSRKTLVERDPKQIMSGRQVRYALTLLLRGRGLELPPGEEMRGLHRRWIFRGLAHVAAVACEKRGLVAPTPAELAEVERRAAEEFGRVRRFSLVRGMLGRLLELTIVRDRARVLEEAGHEVTVEAVFPPEVSPRNLGILARR